MGGSPKRRRRCVGVSPHPSRAMCWARRAHVGLEANKKANNFAGCLPATRTALDRKIIEPSKINGSIDFSRHSWMMKWRPEVESNYRQCDFQSEHSVLYHTETQAPSETGRKAFGPGRQRTRWASRTKPNMRLSGGGDNFVLKVSN